MFRRIQFLFLPLAVAASLSLPAAHAAAPAAQRPIIQVEKRQDIRVAYDVKDDVWEAGIGKALYYVRGLLEAYKSQGVAPEQLHVSVVLHGPAAYWVLNDAAYQRFKKDEFAYNPNDKVIGELLAHGVSVELCGVTMKAQGWRPEDVLPGVVIVHDAYTRLIDLQQRGYAYIRF
ncbi:MAG: DsrE family protein [Pseudomonadota bacterium]